METLYQYHPRLLREHPDKVPSCYCELCGYPLFKTMSLTTQMTQMAGGVIEYACYSAIQETDIYTIRKPCDGCHKIVCASCYRDVGEKEQLRYCYECLLAEDIRYKIMTQSPGALNQSTVVFARMLQRQIDLLRNELRAVACLQPAVRLQPAAETINRTRRGSL